MAVSPYPIDPALTAIAIAYRNPGYIADLVLPRIPVGKEKFTFLQYGVDTFFNVPETYVGRRSQPNEVVMGATEVTDSTEDHGLAGGVPQADVDNADARYDPLGDETSMIMELIAIRREMRAAGIVFNPATYDPGLILTLSGGSQFSDPGSDPIAVINDNLDLPLMRPNQLIFGQGGWSKFRRHPAIVSAILGNAGNKGIIKKEQVAELFEVDEVIVGQARGNTAKRGQTPTLSRLWGNHIAATYKNPVPQAKGAMTFGGTFTWGDPVASQNPKKPGEMGLRGGVQVIAGESVKERVIASQAGFLFQNAFTL